MKKIVLAFIFMFSILLLFAKSDAATWEYLASSGAYVYYYDVDNIGNLSEITVQIILKHVLNWRIIRFQQWW